MSKFDYAEPTVMSVAEVAHMLRISRSKAYEIFRQASFPSYTLGKRLFVRRADFEAWCKANLKKA